MSANVRHSSEGNEHYSPEPFVEAARSVMGGIDLDPATSLLANEVVRAATIFTAASNGFGREWFGRVWNNPPGGKCDAVGVTVTSEDVYVDGRIVLKKGKAQKKWSCAGKALPACDHEHVGVQSSQKAWWFKLVREWTEGRVDQAVFVAFSLELLQTTQSNRPQDLPYALAFPICYPSSRIAYDKVVDAKREESDSPPHSSALIYLPPREANFCDHAIERFAASFSAFGHVNETLHPFARIACDRAAARLAAEKASLAVDSDAAGPDSSRSAQATTPTASTTVERPAPPQDARKQTNLQF